MPLSERQRQLLMCQRERPDAEVPYTILPLLLLSLLLLHTIVIIYATIIIIIIIINYYYYSAI